MIAVDHRVSTIATSLIIFDRGPTLMKLFDQRGSNFYAIYIVVMNNDDRDDKDYMNCGAVERTGRAIIWKQSEQSWYCRSVK